MSEGSTAPGQIPLSRSLGITLLCLVFGANAVAIKLSLTGFGPLTNGALRLVIAAAAISLWARLTGRTFTLAPGQLRQMAILGGLFTIQSGMFYVGIERTLASRATLIANLQPFLVLVGAHFFVPGDRMTVRKLAGVSLGFVGVAGMFLIGERASSGVHTGDLLVGVAVLAWTCNVLYLKRIIDGYEPFQVAVFPMLFVAPALFVGGLLFDGEMVSRPDAVAVGGLLFQGLLATGLGFVLWNRLVKRYGVVALHSHIFIVPVAGVLLGGIVLDEPVATAPVIWALAFIVAGVMVVNWRARRRAGTRPGGAHGGKGGRR